MVSSLVHFLGLALLVLRVAASPVARDDADTFTTLSTTEITSFRPFTHYASTAYCKPANTLAWNCGANCDANPTFVPIASGGDSVVTQFWYVGYDPTLQTVIVGHQGTVFSQIIPAITDVNIILRPLLPSLFPGVPAGVLVHDGFADSQERSAHDVLAAVQTALAQSGLSQVTVVGHSLGAALALLDSAYLPLHLPSTVKVRLISYGMPRVGNQAFATYVSSAVSDLTHINNKLDIVPILPGRFLGFHHPTGEKHIQPDLEWIACPGSDNTDERCSTGAVKNIFAGDTGDHDGPYDTITMGC